MHITQYLQIIFGRIQGINKNAFVNMPAKMNLSPKRAKEVFTKDTGSPALRIDRLFTKNWNLEDIYMKRLLKNHEYQCEYLWDLRYVIDAFSSLRFYRSRIGRYSVCNVCIQRRHCNPFNIYNRCVFWDLNRSKKQISFQLSR